MPTLTRLAAPLVALWLAIRSAVWNPTPQSMRRIAFWSIVVNAGITVTGAVVRVSKSGLGCPTWPGCTADSYIPVAHPEHSPLNMAIEFGNRLLTFVVLAFAVAALIAALRLAPRRRTLVRLASLQPLGVAVQGLWGGLVVGTNLNPVTVQMHFVFSIALIAACVGLYVRAGEGDGPPRRIVHQDIRRLGHVLVIAVFGLLLAGTVVTGTGPHSGDERASRFDFDIETVARIHADFVWAVAGLTFALLFALHVSNAPGRARQAAFTLFLVELSQGVIGYVQYFTALPAFLAGLHVLGAVLVWIATLRVVYLLRERDPVEAAAPSRPLAEAVSG
ncbi:COX15/CtaA family protein [Rhizohabitans arisaemae]|uniref:COX15/CtaA family protein n=1 Tax=Rhizohabitans arisaemae TaxID=2720610 RepID=UPI0024B0843E|nr:COX15/CtaA family protein [Rhizohabitans arisaemae]